MASKNHQFEHRFGGAIIVTALAIIAAFAIGEGRRAALAQDDTGAAAAEAEPAAGEEFVELAPYMTQLQTLTHKLGLSVEHSNHRLAEFYLYESLELLEDIKTDVPEYRGHLIALLTDQIATPAYNALVEAIKDDKAAKERTNQRSAAAFETLVNTCNACHAATQHEFIKIAVPKGVNPFLQEFSPGE